MKELKRPAPRGRARKKDAAGNKPATALNVHDAKTHLSRHLERVKEGETIVICRRNVPIAEIRPIPPAGPPLEPRPIGLGAGTAALADAFFAPLPDDMLDAFEGRAP